MASKISYRQRYVTSTKVQKELIDKSIPLTSEIYLTKLLINFEYFSTATLNNDKTRDNDNYLIILKSLRSKVDTLLVFQMSCPCMSGLSFSRGFRFLSFCSRLKVLSINQGSWNDIFFCRLYIFMKEKYLKNQSLNLQVYKIYTVNLKQLKDPKRGVYVLSLAARCCKSMFHTQTGMISTIEYYHTFLTSADYASRKKTPSKVSLGAWYTNGGANYKEYQKLSKLVKIIDNPKGWGNNMYINDEIIFEYE